MYSGLISVFFRVKNRILIITASHKRSSLLLHSHFCSAHKANSLLFPAKIVPADQRESFMARRLESVRVNLFCPKQGATLSQSLARWQEEGSAYLETAPKHEHNQSVGSESHTERETQFSADDQCFLHVSKENTHSGGACYKPVLASNTSLCALSWIKGSIVHAVFLGNTCLVAIVWCVV